MEYKPILATYDGKMKFLGLTDRDVIQRGGLDAEGVIEASDVLEQA